jgi:hypothetical protein
MDRRQYFRLFSIVGAFLVGFWLPIRLIGFTPPTYLEVFFDLLVSGISVINIWLYCDKHELDIKKIKTWSHLSVVLDFICVLPLSFFAFIFFDTTVAGFLFLNLLTVRHVRHIKPFLDYFDSLQPITYRLVPVVVALPLLVHLVACGWIGLGSGSAAGVTDSAMIYAKAVYWAFTTLTTVGYGDIVAVTIPQMLYCCLVQVMGVGVFGYILSNVAGLLARSDAAREHHMDNLDKVETFMKTHHIPQDLRLKIRSYYHYMWLNKRGYKDDSLLEGLPLKIQSELFFHINQSIIEKIPFLKGADQDLIEELMYQLKPRVYIPGEKIFKIDDYGDALYFIHQGEVEILNRDQEHLALLTDGAFFGEMALISDQPRVATARAHSYCDIYILERELFDKVTKAHPDFMLHLKQITQVRRSA